MIPQDFADAFERIKDLVSIFSQNEERYLSPGYSEAQARLDFIDKFWIALGWDVRYLKPFSITKRIMPKAADVLFCKMISSFFERHQ